MTDVRMELSGAINQPDGTSFVIWDAFQKTLPKPKKGRALIVGSRVYEGRVDRRRLYTEPVGIDMLDGPGVDHVHDLQYPLPEEVGKFAHVECMSVMEHCPRPWLLAQNLEDAMLPGATIWLSVPFVWRVHGYPSDYWRFTTEAVKLMFPRIEWERLEYSGNVERGTASMRIRHGLETTLTLLPRTEVFGYGRKRK